MRTTFNIALMMEAVRTAEMSIHLKGTTWRSISEVCCLQHLKYLKCIGSNSGFRQWIRLYLGSRRLRNIIIIRKKLFDWVYIQLLLGIQMCRMNSETIARSLLFRCLDSFMGEIFNCFTAVIEVIM